MLANDAASVKPPKRGNWWGPLATDLFVRLRHFELCVHVFTICVAEKTLSDCPHLATDGLETMLKRSQ